MADSAQREAPARILGIETSCDETAAAVVANGREILGNVVLSQVPVHQIYGGVVPELASREHLRAIVPVVREALQQAGLGTHEVDAIGVTRGPGLAGALLVGLTYAKALAWATAKPLIGVHHLEGHLHAVLLEQRRQGRPDPPMPAIALVVSGGHTLLCRVERDPTDPERLLYRNLGQTRDDAAGEAFDKVAKLLGLGYPGGPLLDRLAPAGDDKAVAFGRIRLKGNPLDFSFSGLKTAVLRHLQAGGMEAGVAARRQAVTELGRAPTAEEWLGLCDRATLDLMASFQAAVVTDLVDRTLIAVEQSFDSGDDPAAAVFLTGGVAANRRLRQRLEAAAGQLGIDVFAPSLSLCTDNAAMIAAAAYPSFRRNDWSDFRLSARPQAPLGSALADPA